MNEQVVAFYRKVRGDSTLANELAAAEDASELVTRAVSLGRKHGFSFSEDDAHAAFRGLPELIRAAANDDELTDDELELVAAGSVESTPPSKPIGA